MKCVKITVLETTRNRFADEYGIPELGTCPRHKAGEPLALDD